MADYDNLCKLLAEKYPRDFTRWLLNQESQSVEVLKTELSIEPIRADSVTFLQTENRILHLEFQTTVKSQKTISLRMLDYYVRLTRTYQIPVTQVVIFLQETSNAIAFTEEYVSEVTTHRYRVIRMWEQDSTLFLRNPALLPLAPLTQTNSPEILLSQVAKEIAKIPDTDVRQTTAAYTEILAGLKFEKNSIYQLLPEETMQESVIYQDILQKGEQRIVLRQLERRFSAINSSLIERIRSLSVEKLEVLADVLLDFSEVNDLVTWLDQQDIN